MSLTCSETLNISLQLHKLIKSVQSKLSEMCFKRGIYRKKRLATETECWVYYTFLSTFVKLKFPTIKEICFFNSQDVLNTWPTLMLPKPSAPTQLASKQVITVAQAINLPMSRGFYLALSYLNFLYPLRSSRSSTFMATLQPTFLMVSLPIAIYIYLSLY